MDISKFISDPEVALLIILILGAVSAFALGKVVPRYIFDREVANNSKLAEALDKLVPALAKLVETVETKLAAILENQEKILGRLEALTAEVRRK
jgi:hypothetical protein